MYTLNLIHPEQGNITFGLFKFPDGETHIKLEEINRKDSVNVICRITNAEDLFVLMQIGDILNRQAVEFDLTIYYLMSMRMDRVMTFNESFSLKIVADVINNMKPSHVYILEPHSERTMKMINNSKYLQIPDPVRCYVDFDNVTLCYPDKGAFDRYSFKDNLCDVICLNKKRNVETGEIIGLKIDVIPKTVKDTILITDDLCDGGRTFVEASKLLRSQFPDKKIAIAVTHAVNKCGIEKLSENFDDVYITNSYYDWQNEYHLSNVHIVDLFK